ncbi:MAG: flagellar export chaperone FliS [Acidobacteriota bacterium]|jgi:flagellar protein FliS|nr:flagellar export chaperone FliS [Bryobacteraceae bacterium CoA2 C42]MCA2964282.1 flagellar export chaperone FliS [Acidobacteriaceae bacterium]
MSLAAYQNSQDLNVLSASPVELVRLLYRGAIAAVRTARENLETGDIRGRSRQITKACSIIEELTVSLDKERGGKVALDLAELYVYMHQRLIQANIEQIGGPLAEVEKLLVTLLEAWQQVPDELSQPVREERPAVPSYGARGDDDYMAVRPSVHLSA